jgi:hypothetical protein
MIQVSLLEMEHAERVGRLRNRKHANQITQHVIAELTVLSARTE